jgi:hypothetical protein
VAGCDQMVMGFCLLVCAAIDFLMLNNGNGNDI